MSNSHTIDKSFWIYLSIAIFLIIAIGFAIFIDIYQFYYRRFY